jgi:hypothetical protein
MGDFPAPQGVFSGLKIFRESPWRPVEINQVASDGLMGIGIELVPSAGFSRNSINQVVGSGWIDISHSVG